MDVVNKNKCLLQKRLQGVFLNQEFQRKAICKDDIWSCTVNKTIASTDLIFYFWYLAERKITNISECHCIPVMLLECDWTYLEKKIPQATQFIAKQATWLAILKVAITCTSIFSHSSIWQTPQFHKGLFPWTSNSIKQSSCNCFLVMLHLSSNVSQIKD